MDTSTSKALIMVAGFLLAIIVIGFVAFSFRKMGGWATTEDDEILIEQKEKFNKEYEVFDKNLMYGVDVISCLNKVKTNNDKIEGKYAERTDEAYQISVHLELAQSKPLEESITIYHMNTATGAYSANKNEFAYENKEGPTKDGTETGTKMLLGELDSKNRFKFLQKIDKSEGNYSAISKFNAASPFKTTNTECNIKSTKFDLTYDNKGENETDLRNLLSATKFMSEIIKNYDSKTNSKEKGWTKAEFRSALYDLKTRKFKCEEIGYNVNTGLVNSISFRELR